MHTHKLYMHMHIHKKHVPVCMHTTCTYTHKVYTHKLYTHTKCTPSVYTHTMYMHTKYTHNVHTQSIHTPKVYNTHTYSCTQTNVWYEHVCHHQGCSRALDSGKAVNMERKASFSLEFYAWVCCQLGKGFSFQICTCWTGKQTGCQQQTKADSVHLAW